MSRQNGEIMPHLLCRIWKIGHNFPILTPSLHLSLRAEPKYEVEGGEGNEGDISTLATTLFDHTILSQILSIFIQNLSHRSQS